MKTFFPVEPCDDQRLQALLQADEDSAKFAAAASHVEVCERCQGRLSELAAAADEWSETRELLNLSEADAIFASECRDRTWSVTASGPTAIHSKHASDDCGTFNRRPLLIRMASKQATEPPPPQINLQPRRLRNETFSLRDRDMVVCHCLHNDSSSAIAPAGSYDRVRAEGDKASRRPAEGKTTKADRGRR